MPFLVTQTQDDDFDVEVDRRMMDDIAVKTLALAVPTKSKKRLIQSTLDGAKEISTMITDQKVKRNIHPLKLKTGIRVKSHTRQHRTGSSKNLRPKKKTMTINDPNLAESVRLAHKMKFDDLMRYREVVFAKKAPILE